MDKDLLDLLLGNFLEKSKFCNKNLSSFWKIFQCLLTSDLVSKHKIYIFLPYPALYFLNKILDFSHFANIVQSVNIWLSLNSSNLI